MEIQTHTCCRQCVGECVVTKKDSSKLFIVRYSTSFLHFDCLGANCLCILKDPVGPKSINVCSVFSIL